MTHVCLRDALIGSFSLSVRGIFASWSFDCHRNSRVTKPNQTDSHDYMNKLLAVCQENRRQNVACG